MTFGPSANTYFRNTAALLLMIATLAAATGASQDQAAERNERSKGEQCLFAGHSFFCPVAQSFNRIAELSDFPDHEMDIVFRGGVAGTAGALWNSRTARRAIESKLETGEVQLFGLTPGLADNLETFQNWFDLAIKYNPKTRFFIGIPWAVGGQKLENDEFDERIDRYAEMGHAIVEELRNLYPENRIDYVAYGKIAPAMKRRFEAGTLPDIEVMVGKGRNALFSDNRLGHAGPMLLELCSLTWLREIYGAELDSLTFSKHKSDVPEIIEEVMTFNAPFRARAAEAPKTKTIDDRSTTGTPGEKMTTDGRTEQRLRELGVTLPEVRTPVGSYLPAVRAGNLLHVSGQLPFLDGKLTDVGPVPSEVSLESAQQAARLCAINALAAARQALGGDLDRIKRVVRVGAYVHSDEGFTDQAKVANGASNFLVDIFGEAGRHVRIAIGANAMPLGTPVEIEFTFELR